MRWTFHLRNPVLSEHCHNLLFTFTPLHLKKCFLVLVKNKQETMELEK